MEIDLSCAIFLKRILFEDLKNNVPRCLTCKYTNTNTQIHKYKYTKNKYKNYKYTNTNVQAGKYTPEAACEHPEAVRQLALEFARAGGDVTQTFTYGSTEGEIEMMMGKMEMVRVTKMMMENLHHWRW